MIIRSNSSAVDFALLKDGKLIDLKNSDVGPINIYKKIDGRKIKSVEVLVKLED